MTTATEKAKPQTMMDVAVRALDILERICASVEKLAHPIFQLQIPQPPAVCTGSGTSGMTAGIMGTPSNWVCPICHLDVPVFQTTFGPIIGAHPYLPLSP